MRPFKSGEIANRINGEIYRGDSESVVKSVHQDSRLVTEDSCFFAIAGDAFDGHNFIDSAVEKGCSAVVVEQVAALENIDTKDVCIILVSDTTVALQALATYYMKTLKALKIAVTGSTGKTTTRDMIYSVCKEKYKTQKNQGNFNSIVGVPLTIMALSPTTEVAVIEMGMDRSGEIDLMANMVKPDIGVITNIGISHIENFENKKEIFRAKMEVAKYFGEDNKLIVAEDEEFLNRNRIEEEGDIIYQLILTGDKEGDQYLISKIYDEDESYVSFDLTHGEEKKEFKIPFPGRHNAFNAALAIAVGKEIGVSFDEAAKGLQNAKITGNRLSIEMKNGIKIINDTYNASPDSMKAALDILSKTKGNRRIAILGDMYELGKDEIKYHKEVGEFAKAKADIVITVGKLGEHISSENHFESKEQLIARLDDIIESGDVVLVKASRGMHLEEIISKI